MARKFSSVAVETTLSFTISSSATSMTVGSVTGWPTSPSVSAPYSVILDPDTASEEVVEVTGAAGTVLTIVRGVDGTTAKAHNAGAVAKHGVSARDFSEPAAHIDNTTTAHGVSGAVVGTTSTQTLTNKTIDASANTISNIANANVAAAASIAASKIAGTAVTQADSGTVTSAMIANGTIVDADINASAAIAVSKLASSSVTVGSTSVSLGGTAATVAGLTLTGATLNAASTIGGISGTTISGWASAWTSYTPTLSGTGNTLGNGTLTGKYLQVGKTVYFTAFWDFGTTSAMGTYTLISLPVTSAGGIILSSMCEIVNAGSSFVGFISAVGTTTVQVRYLSDPTITLLPMGPTDPATWNSSSSISISGIYEAA